MQDDMTRQIVSFEILGFEQQSTIQILTSQASKFNVSLSCSRDNDYEIVAIGSGVDLELFFQELQSLFGERLLHGDLAHFLIHKLTQKSLTICVSESCTGGVLSSLLTSVQGASNAYKGGIVAYSIESKKQILGVQDFVFKDFGVYSEECVKAMAKGAMDIFGADIAIATSGLASEDTSGHNFLNLPIGYVFTCVLCKSMLPVVISQNYLSKDALDSYTPSFNLERLYGFKNYQNPQDFSDFREKDSNIRESNHLKPNLQNPIQQNSSSTLISSRIFIQQEASLFALRLVLNTISNL
ncbi:CinA family protein [Helicobacter muridarum]|uniref:CinA family protein n=1 Tax=Helicobacter muridarum TaxID=216 RepID=A0A377PV89_9HELI|nr:CinA family protein [Helicobacter muridarum]TLE01572.1 CinA family protein [Helicobacter muridarum]STQ86181.1 Molybdenum cofactor biosynthesis protein [Helicobacter muridarum]